MVSTKQKPIVGTQKIERNLSMPVEIIMKSQREQEKEQSNYKTAKTKYN